MHNNYVSCILHKSPSSPVTSISSGTITKHCLRTPAFGLTKLYLCFTCLQFFQFFSYNCKLTNQHKLYLNKLQLQQQQQKQRHKQTNLNTNQQKLCLYQKAQSDAPETLYKALPVQVLDSSDGNATSLETQSNPSLQSQQTTSDDSDTVRVYDFNKQETTVLKTTTEITEQPSTSSTTTTPSMESALGTPSGASSSSIDASRKRERPVVLQFGPADTVPAVCASPTMSTSRGSTPPAFRFLQPKRRLIEPSQVLSIDEDEVVSRTILFSAKQQFTFLSID